MEVIIANCFRRILIVVKTRSCQLEVRLLALQLSRSAHW